MKILIATGLFPPDIGGPAIHSATMAEELTGRGHQVKIIIYRDEDLLERDGHSRFTIYKVSKKGNLLFRYPRYFRQIYKLADWADIIYAYDLTSVGLPCAIVRLLNHRAKLIIRLGGDIQWENALQRGDYFDTLEQYYLDKKFSLGERIFYLLTNFVLARADQIIFNAHILRDIYIKHRKIDKNKTTVIKNIKPLIDNSYQPRSQKDYVNILFIGRLVAFKNLLNLIRAFADLKSDWPKKVTLEIGGQGPEKEKLENYVRGEKMADKVKILPKLSHQEVIKKIQQSDIIAVISLTEVNAHFAAEALTLNKPIILTKESESYYCGDKNDLIYYVNPFDLTEITKTIELCLRTLFNGHHYQTKGAGDRIIWDIEKVVKAHLGVFNKLLER